MIERGSPLGFMLKYSVVLLDRGCLSMVRSRPRVTEYTMKTLRRSILVALGLAIEHYYLGDAEGFPVSDEELLSRSPEDVKGLFKKLIEMRRREVNVNELREAIEETIEVITRKLGLKKDRG